MTLSWFDLRSSQSLGTWYWTSTKTHKLKRKDMSYSPFRSLHWYSVIWKEAGLTLGWMVGEYFTEHAHSSSLLPHGRHVQQARQSHILNIWEKGRYQILLCTGPSWKVPLNSFYGWRAQETNGMCLPLNRGYFLDRLAAASYQRGFQTMELL